MPAHGLLIYTLFMRGGSLVVRNYPVEHSGGRLRITLAAATHPPRKPEPLSCSDPVALMISETAFRAALVVGALKWLF